MNIKRTLLKALMLFMMLATACKKDNVLHDHPNILPGKLKEEHIQLDGELKYVYHYDDDQTLNKQELWVDGILIASNDYRYLNNKLYFRTYSEFSGAKTLRVISITKYTYTGDLLTTAVENVLERHGGESDIITNIVYTEEGLIKSARERRINEFGVSEEVVRDFTTGANGNILRINEVKLTRGLAAPPTVYTMQYDDKRNPRYGLIDPLEFTEYFSPNNVVDLHEKGLKSEKSVQFYYEYNDNWLPTTLEANDLIQNQFRNVAIWIYY